MQKQKIVLATHNRDKIREMKSILSDLNYQVLSLDDFESLPDVVEDMDTLEGNAIKKAKEIFIKTGYISLADDTGLFVDCLNGKPGVHSARFAGEKATYEENRNKLLKQMEGVPIEKRTAQFKCVIAIAFSINDIKIAEGCVNGMITTECRGNEGFGYDPLFLVPELNKTYSELDSAIKNKISHRALALKKAKEILTTPQVVTN